MSDTLARILGIERLGEDTFGATIGSLGTPRLFGGQVAGQALLAAAHTVSGDRPAHSLHGYFILAGRPGVPLLYEVDRVREGRSFATRRVSARQEGATIFELLASFQRAEPGPDWQPPAPEMGELPPRPGHYPLRRLQHLRNHLDIRRVDPTRPHGMKIHPFWFRTDPPIGTDPAMNAAMLTYVSDIALMANARAPGTNEPMVMAASIDHALWFHRVPAVDDWLYFSTEPVANIGTRGLVRGAFHTQDGALVATVTQEGLLRPAVRKS